MSLSCPSPKNDPKNVHPQSHGLVGTVVSSGARDQNSIPAHSKGSLSTDIKGFTTRQLLRRIRRRKEGSGESGSWLTN